MKMLNLKFDNNPIIHSTHPEKLDKESHLLWALHVLRAFPSVSKSLSNLLRRASSLRAPSAFICIDHTEDISKKNFALHLNFKNFNAIYQVHLLHHASVIAVPVLLLLLWDFNVSQTSGVLCWVKSIFDQAGLDQFFGYILDGILLFMTIILLSILNWYDVIIGNQIVQRSNIYKHTEKRVNIWKSQILYLFVKLVIFRMLFLDV